LLAGITTKSIRRSAITVGSVAAMLGIVLPLPAASLAAVDVAAVDVVSVKIVVVVDVDVAAVVPIAITPVVVRPDTARDDAGAKREPHSRHIPRVGIWVIRIRGRPINHRRVVGRDVNNFRVRLLNHDDLLATLHRLSLHRLFLAGLQGSFALRFGAHALDGIKDILLLREKGVPQVGRPLDVAGQSLHSLRNTGHRLHARVPLLFCDRISQHLAFQVFVLLHPLLKLNDLERIRGRGQRLGQQRIGIKSDRRD
jgi:hypothetical protein